MSTSTSTRYRDPFAAVDKIQHEAQTQGLTTEQWDKKIVPLLDSMVKMKFNLSDTYQKIEYEIDWEPFNKVVEESRPYDLRTLLAIKSELDLRILKGEAESVDDGLTGPNRTGQYREFQKYINKQIIRAGG